MNLQLDGHGVIFFGAARGIGLAIATAFAAEGCRVIGVDRQQPEDTDANASIQFVSGDVSLIDDVLVRRLGRWPNGIADGPIRANAIRLGSQPITFARVRTKVL